jgi:nucleotide-binding universal stress UspA family protein
MFNQILVALDGSGHAQNALETATRLAQQSNAELTLFNVLPTGSFNAYIAEAVTQAARKIYRDAALAQKEEILNRAEAVAHDHGLSQVRKSFAEGDPAQAIVTAAKNNGIDLIVIGTRGLTGIRELALGSVAHKVTALAACPVLVVR